MSLLIDFLVTSIYLLLKDKNLEPMEIKFSKSELVRLKQCLLEMKTISMQEGNTEPNLYLFIIKQTYLDANRKIGFAWPESKTRPQSANPRS